MTSLQDAFRSGDYSDFTVICGPDSYPVHKLILCTRSDFFAKAVKFGKEAKEGKIDLVEDDPTIVKLMLHYFYWGDYDASSHGTAEPDPTTSVPSGVVRMGRRDVCGHNYYYEDCPYCPETRYFIEEDCEALVIHAKMYAIAEKYNIIGLKQLAKERFEPECEYFWNHSEFPIAANIVYDSTPENDKGLRDIVVKTIVSHMELLQKPEIEAVMTDYSGLLFGVLKEKAQMYGWK